MTASVQNCAPATTATVVQEAQFAVRLVLALLAATVAQALVAPHLAPPGAAPDLLLLTAVAVAATVPAPAAVAFAFAAGLAADLLLVTPFGLSAAVFIAVVRAVAGPPPPRRAVAIVPLVAAAAVLAGALVLFAGAALRTGRAPSSDVLGLLVRSAGTAAFLSPPVLAAVRWLVGARGR